MILKLMFAFSDGDHGPQSVYFDHLDQVEHHDPSTWNEVRAELCEQSDGWYAPVLHSPGFLIDASGTPAKPVFVAVADREGGFHHHRTAFEVYDPHLMAVWLMSDDGDTIDQLYRSY